MPNHFHLLVRIKEVNEIGFIPRKQKQPLSGFSTADRVVNRQTPSAVENPDGGLNTDNEKKYKPSNQFSHLFNSYAQAYNKRFNRTGSLFESPFERIWVDNERYCKNLVIYIHNNPVHHGFVENTIEYAWTSYLTIKSYKPTKLLRKEVILWFENIENFEFLHNSNDNSLDIEKYIIE